MAFADDRTAGRTLRLLLGPALACGLVFAAAPAFAQFGGCDKAALKTATEDYIKAQQTGDTSVIPMTLWLDYNEQMQEGTMATGIISKPLKIDFHRSIYDGGSCTSFTEVIVTDPTHPYELGVVIQARGGQVGSIDILKTDKDNGWLFNPASTMKYSQAETWSEIPPAERESRDALIAAADAYLDLFNDKTAKVPWGSPCERLEGGMYTGKGGPGVSLPDDSCNVGVPSGVPIVDRQYIVDETLGAVTVLSTFGKNQVPDAHTFRIEHGKLRYVHTITVCKTFNCGLKLPTELQTASTASH